MHVQAVLIFATILVVACEGAAFRNFLRFSPVEETDLKLTANDDDTGNWTAKLGDIQINIEHKHDNAPRNFNGSWIMDIARTYYHKEENIEESAKTEVEKNKEAIFTEAEKISKYTSVHLPSSTTVRPYETTKRTESSSAEEASVKSVNYDEAPEPNTTTSPNSEESTHYKHYYDHDYYYEDPYF